MGKFEDYGILAGKYYSEEQLSIKEISSKLNISTKTLLKWKKKYNWEDKKKSFLSSQYNCYASLQELLMYLSKDALTKIKSGEVPESASLNFIAKMSEKLPKIKLINEENTKTQNKESDTQKQIAEMIDKNLCR